MLTAVVHDASEEVIASGEVSVDVTEGQNNTATVTGAATTGATGTLDLTVSWDPASLIDAVKSATIAPD